MGLIAFETECFTGSTPPPTAGNLSVSIAQLLSAAATVGATPVGLGTPPRPIIELVWRMALVGSNVEDNGRRWHRTAAYNRLDRSEKSAVSYFLGMAQTKVMCAGLLHVSHLVHLDAWMSIQRYPPTRVTRPDLVGLNVGNKTVSIAVEAKGRSGDWDRKVVDKAKAQAMALPKLVTTTSALRVASLAYFNTRREWCSYLEDPEGNNDELYEPLSIESLLVAYYRPLVAAVLDPSVIPADAGDDDIRAGRLPGLDVVFGLPHSIIRIVQTLPLVGPISQEDLEGAGQALVQEVTRVYRIYSSRAVVDVQPDQRYAITPARYVGLDGVLVELGPSWL
jgi:hypothetical protein